MIKYILLQKAIVVMFLFYLDRRNRKPETDNSVSRCCQNKMSWILHNPLVHVATNDYITSASLCNLHSNQPLNDHGGARMKTTWLFAMARILLAQSWENDSKRE